jgi:hypothetical protein
MANESNISRERCDGRNKMMEQPGSEGVAQESDHLSILGDQPSSYTQTSVISAPSQEHMVTIWYDEYTPGRDVSMDEFITTLRESQQEMLQFEFQGANDEVEDGNSSNSGI